MVIDYISKMVGIILSIVLIIIIPIIAIAAKDVLRTERIAWNSLVEYKNTVTRKGAVTQEDYENFVNTLASTGKEWNITLEVEQCLFINDNDTVTSMLVTTGIWRSSLNGVQETSKFTEGDMFHITIEPIASSANEQIIQRITGLIQRTAPYSISGVFENSGYAN